VTIRWKACVVATSTSSKLNEVSIDQLQQSGWEDILVYAPRGARLSDRHDVALCRCNNVSIKDQNCDYQMVYTALDAVITASMRDTTFIVVAKPGVFCWEQLQHYCESQLEPSRLAVYCFNTPNLLFDSERCRRPEPYNGDGFYRIAVKDRLLAADFFVLTPATAKVLLAILPNVEKEDHTKAEAFNTFAHALGNAAFNMRSLELYYHMRSLVRTHGAPCDDFVGVSYVMPNKELNEIKDLNVWKA
jgi:hypothetical protein